MFNHFREIIKEYLDEKLFKCRHEKINLTNKLKFCPDCGQRVHLSWLVAVCSDCNFQRETVLICGKPYSRYSKCPECGSNRYKILKVPEIDQSYSEHFVIVKEAIPAGRKHSDFSSLYQKRQLNYLKSLKNNLAYRGLFKPDTSLIK